jgi:type I restriction enzyme M protein
MSIAKWCGHDSRGNKIPHDDIPLISNNYNELQKDKHSKKYSRLGFMCNFSELKNNIVIPKYYDPEIEMELKKLRQTHDLVTIGDLIKNKVISLSTGVEIGKLSYGTGHIPFIRTSDLTNWELKIDPKHGVSEEIYKKYHKKCNLQENDILMVRDGTYLVGTTALITKYDVGNLFQSHIVKIKVLKPETISPFVLLAILNSPVVKRQIRSKQFTQDIIDTLGGRIAEVVLPIPKDENFKKKIEKTVKEIIQTRADLRNKAREISLEVLGKYIVGKEEKEIIEDL